jgi:hypothetical protein
MILFLAALFMVLVTEVLLAGQVSRAADDCITKPNSTPPQGSHWYYRTERSTQRQCWYLKPEGEKMRASVDQPMAAAQPPSAPKPVSTPAPQKFEAAAVEPTAIESKAASENLPITGTSVEPSGIGNGVLTNKPIADEAPIKTSSADEHLATEMSDVAMVAPPMAKTEQPVEYEITLTSLAILSAVLVFVAVIVQTIFRIFFVRRFRRTKRHERCEPSLGNRVKSPSLSLGEHVEPEVSNSDARFEIDPLTPPMRHSAAEIEATVRLLLRELRVRPHHDVQRLSRKVAPVRN